MKVHKLKFKDKAEFQEFIDTYDMSSELMKTDDRIVAISIVAETGLIPNPTEYDEEGNPLPVTFIDAFHVDVMTTEVIQEWKEFTVTGEHHWYHSFGYGEVVTEQDFN
jgi:hypothetical protein